MQNRKLARRYATAVFKLATEANAVDVVGSDLRAMTTTLASSPALQRFFLSPVFQRHEKERLLHEAFGPHASTIALHTLLLLVRKRREALLGAISAEYATLALEAAGKEPLGDRQRSPARAGRSLRDRRPARARLGQGVRRHDPHRPEPARRHPHHDGRPSHRRLARGTHRRPRTRPRRAHLISDHRRKGK